MAKNNQVLIGRGILLFCEASWSMWSSYHVGWMTILVRGGSGGGGSRRFDCANEEATFDSNEYCRVLRMISP